VGDDEALRLGAEMADAAQGGRTDDVLALLTRRATVDVLDSGYNRWTALMWAGWWGNNKMARALLEAGANPALRDSKGCSAYDVAIHEEKVNTAAIIAGQTRAFVPSYVPRRRERLKQRGQDGPARRAEDEANAMEVDDVVLASIPIDGGAMPIE